MLKNFLTLIYRNFLRNKFYSTVNIIGLAAGMVASILIFLFILNELNFDRMHADANRIFRVVETRSAPDREYKTPKTAGILAPVLKNDQTGVENYVRMIGRYTAGRFTVKYGDNKFYEGNYYFAEQSFFDLFDFPYQEYKSNIGYITYGSAQDNYPYRNLFD